MLNGAAVNRSVTVRWAGPGPLLWVSLGGSQKICWGRREAHLRTFWQRGTGTENYGRPSPPSMLGSWKGQDGLAVPELLGPVSSLQKRNSQDARSQSPLWLAGRSAWASKGLATPLGRPTLQQGCWWSPWPFVGSCKWSDGMSLAVCTRPLTKLPQD